ncbi:hypothetical protein [Amycolatopsis regifaucium]|uniref:Uncharacterized protein n=1 Tax=Amycolatopsis regifaucium TaxID=546365 RepID=A0A154MKU6_9PSEU|nr:hypothetical protein [Amycolatopsis regifaucium]KZB84925.1 hypothetical protein AVL48_01570 [Amycolatopsis regifaucium]OKA03942.1 hypothetical protein ATP06_0232425 [Amycolatopsis regifaucium]SFI00037.1 hypothetical protein SAMN04489731_107379 [Amycolatopsis regifaucium]
MTISDWKRAIYALLALPAYFGGAKAQRGLARRWLGQEGGARPRFVAAFGPSVLAFLLALLLFYLVGRIATYGLFWTGSDPEGTWGGPTPAGAWIVHFFVALGMAVPIFLALRPLTRLQARLLG